MNGTQQTNPWIKNVMVWGISAIFMLAFALVPLVVVLAVTDSDTGHLPGNDICSNSSYPYRNPENPRADQSVTLRARALSGGSDVTGVIFWYTTNAAAADQGDWSSISAMDETDLNCNSTTYNSWAATIPAQETTVWYKIAYTDASETKWQTASGEPATLSTSTTWTTGSTTLNYQPPATAYVDDAYVDQISCDIYTWQYDCFGSIQSGIDAVRAAGNVVVAAGTYTEDIYLDRSVTVDCSGDITLVGSLDISAGRWEPPAGNMYLSGDFSNTVPPSQGGFRGNEGGTLILNGTSAQAMNGNGTLTRFNSLSFDNVNGITVNHNQQIGSRLTLSNGIVTLTSYDIVFRPMGIITGTYSTSTMIVTPGAGQVCRVPHPNGAYAHIPFTWPLGDTNGTTEYTPITLVFSNFTDDSFAWNSLLCFRLIDDKHPNLGSQDYLTRYWEIEHVAVTTATVTANFSYMQDDVVGTESNLDAKMVDVPNHNRYTGDPVNTTNNTATISVWNALGDFTGTSEPTAVTMGDFNTFPQRESILLVWNTVIELDHLGFHVYRSTSLDGERQRISPDLIIPPVVGSSEGNDYEFVDESAQAGETYFYWLQAMNTHGGFDWYGPRSSTWFYEIFLPAVSR